MRHSPFKEKCHCNDLDPSISADSHLDALEFLKTIKTGRAEIVLFDPPYSPRQVSEIYKKDGPICEYGNYSSQLLGEYEGRDCPDYHERGNCGYLWVELWGELD